jgi:cytochrome P450
MQGRTITSELPLLPRFPAWPQDEPWPPWTADRTSGPVRVLLPDGHAAWAVTGYHDCRRVGKRWQHFSRAAAVDTGWRTDVTGLNQYVAGTLGGEDPPAHTRLRKLVARAVTPQRIERMQPRITQIVRECMDQMLAAGPPGDLVSGLCMPLPTRVTCDFLGIPPDDVPRALKWAQAIAGHQDDDSLARTFGEMYTTALSWLEARRANPGDDAITAMSRAAAGTDVDDRELTSVLLALLIGGIESAPVVLGLLITALLELGELPRLRSSPLLIPLAVAEGLRWLRFAPDLMLPRVAVHEVELNGVTIREGDRVVALWPAANRDPSVFADPNLFDIMRVIPPETPPLVFGTGAHRCSGAVLAHAELVAAIRAVATRMPGLRLAVPPGKLQFTKGAVHSLTELPVTWDAP